MAISTHHHFHPSTSASNCAERGKASKSIRKRVCFSFAAYAKTLIDHKLRGSSSSRTHRRRVSTNRVISNLLISTRSSINFTRRSSGRLLLPKLAIRSKQQFQLLINLPILGILKSVRDDGFWFNGWGVKPRESDRAVEVEERRLRSAPVLIPVYKSFYIPSEPNSAGNPVFEVVGSEEKVAGFFERRLEFVNDIERVMAPVWKATEARKVKVWTEMAEVERRGSGGWWWWCGGEIGQRLEEAFWRLTDGEWDDDEGDGNDENGR